MKKIPTKNVKAMSTTFFCLEDVGYFIYSNL